ncbi:MAG: hypothetical protein ACFFDS_09815 [Candidatus Thorarchaeota archaeon]
MSSNCLANEISPTINSSVKGKYFVEIEQLSYSTLSEFSFLVEDTWKFRDNKKEIIQLQYISKNVHTSGLTIDCYVTYTYTDLFWKENGSYAIKTAELKAEYEGSSCESYTFKISLLHFKKYKQMIDYEEAVITFRNGTTCLLKNYIPKVEPHMEGYVETQIFTMHHKKPPDFSRYPYMIPPSLQIGAEVDYGCVKGKVTGFSEISVAGFDYEVIEVFQPWIQLDLMNVSETTRYYEKETGLIMKAYSFNETIGELHDMKPEEITIVPFSKINYSSFSIVGVLIIAVYILKRRN